MHHGRMTAVSACAAVALSAIGSSALAGVPGSALGYPELLARLGAGAPTGAGIRVGTVEIPSVGNYGPNVAANAEYSGKTFVEMSGPTGTSTHANTVAKNFYGNASSMAPGITDINLYEVSDWLNAGYLRSNSASSVPPLAPPAGLRIFNNSWTGSTPSLAIVRRADYATTQYDVLMVNGINNSTASADNWNLLTYMYNGISVGKTNGDHQHGDTLSDGTGRMKPEIVASATSTSYAAGMVSSAAALMYETADGFAVAGSADASRTEVIKAVLLAGARHRPAWTNNPATSGANRGVTARPLDDETGVDILNVDNSHMIITGGNYPGMSNPPSSPTINHAGWSLDAIPLDSSRYWRFNIPETADPISIIATWHRDAPVGFSSSFVADIDLQLWRVGTAGELVSLVGNAGLAYFSDGNVVSNSAVDNIEHLYIRNLEPGSYVLEAKRVDNLTAYATWDVAIAWLYPAPENTCLADVVDSQTFQPPPDGVVDGADLAQLLGWWGNNPQSPFDIVDNGTFQPPPDGVVDGADLAYLLGEWGLCN